LPFLSALHPFLCLSCSECLKQTCVVLSLFQHW
jgi:hypothetical protein